MLKLTQRQTSNQRQVSRFSPVFSSAMSPHLQKLAILGSIALLGAVPLSANASTLISSTDYLDYELPKKVQERCNQTDNCPDIEVKYLKTNQDWINKITNARINNLVVNSKPSETPVNKVSNSTTAAKMALDDFANSQFSELPNNRVFVYSLMVTPEYLGHVESFELFELSSYVFTGGAHGMPYSEYLVFDPSTKKQVQLADMLIAGKKPQFKALAYNAYKMWIKTFDNDIADYEKNWPFTLSDNITLTDKGIDIRYQAYAIAPYSSGMPVLSIPYSQLRGVVKPHFISKQL